MRLLGRAFAVILFTIHLSAATAAIIRAFGGI